MFLGSLIAYFFLYSFIGWIGDTAYRSFSERKYRPGSFFPVPLCPIYGFAALLVIFLHRIFGPVPLIFQAVFFGILLAGFEYASGVVILRLFRRRLWKYTGTLFNLGQFTDLSHAILWGVLSVLVIYMQSFFESVFHLSV
jgi:uncharacterized membrane protein